jgi:hypothetical protein
MNWRDLPGIVVAVLLVLILVFVLLYVVQHLG